MGVLILILRFRLSILGNNILDYYVNSYHGNEASFDMVLNIDDIKFVQIEHIN